MTAPASPRRPGDLIRACQDANGWSDSTLLALMLDHAREDLASTIRDMAAAEFLLSDEEVSDE